MHPKIILSFFFTLIVFSIKAQDARKWNLETIDNNDYQITSNPHALAVKTKYTSKHHKATLYNYTPYYRGIKLSIHQMGQYDYYNPNGIQYMGILNDTNNLMDGSINRITASGSSTNYARDFETDSNDNFVVVADNKGINWNSGNPVTSSFTDSTQTLVYKIGIDSKIIWYKLYGGSSAEYAQAIRKAPDGNYYILIQTESADGDITGYNGGKDIWLAKISDSDGSILWKKTIGTSADEIPKDFEVLADGSIVIAGTANNSTLFPSTYAGMNSFLLKLDATGNIIWSKTYGGDGNDLIEAFTIATNGDLLTLTTTSSSNGDYSINSGGSDIYVSRHTAGGTIVWSKHYGLPFDDLAGDIAFGKCDSSIFFSFSKQFTGTQQPFTAYPEYSQNGSILVRLDYKGNDLSYFEDNFPFLYVNSDYDFNFYLTPSIVENDRGGVLALRIYHRKWNELISPASDRGNVVRSFRTEELGLPLVYRNFDTSICKGQTAWKNIIYQADTLFYDTLRNACQIDTAIYRFSVHVINGDLVSTVTSDTTLCFGTIYKNKIVTNSFNEIDTLIQQTNCGPKLSITIRNFTVSSEIKKTLGNDTLLCNPETLTLQAYQPAKSYLWQDGSSGSTFNVTRQGTYWVEITDTFKCKLTDSININYNNLAYTLPADTGLCNSTTLILQAYQQQAKSYVWQDGSTGSSFNVSTAGIYWVEITDQFNCKLTDSVSVNYSSLSLTLPNDTLLCNSASLTLKAYQPARSYVWQDGSTGSSFYVAKPGIYWVEISDQFNCKLTDSIRVNYSDLFLNLPGDTTINYPQQLSLVPITNGQITWQADPSLSCTTCQSAIATPFDNITYRLTSSKDNCIANASIRVTVVKNVYLYIPNAFTPNGDAINNLFKPFSNYKGTYNMKIFNRYGQKLFETSSISEGWNGKYKTVPQNTGNYIYIISYYKTSGHLETLKGNFLLLR